jgi:hypothetical protein
MTGKCPVERATPDFERRAASRDIDGGPRRSSGGVLRRALPLLLWGVLAAGTARGEEATHGGFGTFAVPTDTDEGETELGESLVVPNERQRSAEGEDASAELQAFLARALRGESTTTAPSAYRAPTDVRE